MQQEIIRQLRSLKLSGMASALAMQVEQPGHYSELGFEDRIALLVDSEQLEREQRKQARLLKSADLKLKADAKGIDYSHQRGLERSKMVSLLKCDWINNHQNLLLTGPCGSGKTYLACALGQVACQKGLSVRYFRVSRLFMKLTQGKADGTYMKLLQQFAKMDLLILDDWGLEPLTAPQRNDLMELMDDRNGSSSTILISQLPTEQWYESIGDNTLADAILDRIIHNAHRINLKGESIRKKQSELTKREHLG